LSFGSGLTIIYSHPIAKPRCKTKLAEKFGPVRTVKPELVFEIAFEGIAASNRHKSGVALRFPRMVRWRKDKKTEDINTLEDLKKMLEVYGK